MNHRLFVSRLLVPVFIALFAREVQAQALSCQNLFKAAPYRTILSHSALPDEVKNPAARWYLLSKLKQRLPNGVYNVEIDGHPAVLSVSFEPGASPLRMRLGENQLIQSGSVPLSLDETGTISGLAARFQLIPREKPVRELLIISNDVIFGDDTKANGLSKREIRVEIDLHADEVTTLKVTEKTTNLLAGRKENPVSTTTSVVKIVSRRP